MDVFVANLGKESGTVIGLFQNPKECVSVYKCKNQLHWKKEECVTWAPAANYVADSEWATIGTGGTRELVTQTAFSHMPGISHLHKLYLE